MVVRTIPQVGEDVCAVREPDGRERTIVVGSPEWFAWLDDEDQQRFAFASAEGTFTARKERRARGGASWTAYRRVAGRLGKAYLGKSADLSPDLLRAVAARLAVGDSSEVGGPAESAADLPDLLTTKLHVPQPRPELVPRPRLTALLATDGAWPLTLVSAPAGFGKTTLLAAWIRETGQRVAWVSLDPGDNDPTLFWAYVAAALQSLDRQVGARPLAMLRTRSPVPLQAVLVALLNDLAGLADGLVLVLDDYHQITSPSIHDSLGFLVDHLPSTLRLVLATRADPPLPLAHWRAGNKLLELRAADLRFTPDEATAFLNRATGLVLAPEDVAALERRTEGWIAGLQLAALSMHGRGDPAGLIAGFGGSHRFVLDYLTEQVLLRLSAIAQGFLLETAVLDRMCAPLCDALTGRMDSQTMLERLERDNLFVVALDDERRWYRYHHLFADVLRHRLDQAQPGRSVELHRRATAWYEGQGLVREAVDHAFAARDRDLAAPLIERAAISSNRRGEIGTVRLWLDRVPTAWFDASAGLAIVRAHVQYLDGQYDAAETTLGTIERHLAEGAPASYLAPHVRSEASDPLAERARVEREVAGEIAAIRALVAVGRGDLDAIFAQARRALELLPAGNNRRATVTRVLGQAHVVRGDLDGAGALTEEARALHLAGGDLYGAFLASADLANVHLFRGQLRQAEETYRQALELAAGRDETLAVAGLGYLGLAELAYERNDLAAATRYAEEGVRRGEQLGLGWVQMRGKITLARVRQARGDPAEVPDPARLVPPYTPSPLDLRVYAAYQARLQIGQGDRPAVERWVQQAGLRVDDALDFFHEFEHLTLCRALLALGQPGEALLLLKRLLPIVEAAGRADHAIEVHLLQALAHHARGDLPAALAALERALGLAEPEGYARVFLDEGPRMEGLLAQAERHHLHPHYVRRLRRWFALPPGARPNGGPPGHVAGTPPVDAPLLEPLTEREREVLGLIAAGASNRAIADRLVVSLGTVKKHGNNIYGKLGVQSRTQAIARARELGLL